MRISRLPTWQTARACVIWWPSTASVTSTSITSPGFAYDRYCAVAHDAVATAGAFHRRDRRAETAAAEQEAAPGAQARRDLQAPAKRVVALRETEEGAAVHGEADTTQQPLTSPHGEHTVAGRRLFAGRGVPSRASARRSRSCRRPTTPSTRSDLNAFCSPPREQAEAAARDADVGKPFGGVPIGVKELDDVEGWPATDACVVFADRGRSAHVGDGATHPRRRRRRAGRADHRQRVRWRQRHPHGAARHDPQPVAARAHTGRIVRRQRGGRRRRSGARSPPAATVAGRSAFQRGSPACSD